MEEAFPPKGFFRHSLPAHHSPKGQGKEYGPEVPKIKVNSMGHDAFGQEEAQISPVGDAHRDLMLNFQKAWMALASLRHLFIYRSSPALC